MIALKWRDAWKQQGHAGQWMWSMRPDTYAQSKCPAHIKVALVGFNLVTIHKSTFTYFCCWIQNRCSLLKPFCNKWSWIKHFRFRNWGNMHSQLYTSWWHSIVTTRSFIWFGESVPSSKQKKQKHLLKKKERGKKHQGQLHRFHHKNKCCWYSRCGRWVEAWPRPLTSVVCHEMLFWCQSQPLWPLLPQHNTSSTPQPSVQLIHWASTRIPTIHFPWRLSFPLSLPLPLTPSLARSLSISLLLCASPPLFPSHKTIQSKSSTQLGSKDQ